MNLGISENFGVIDFAHLTFPAKMRVDWIRVYQRSDSINIGCDPKDFPTEAYINEFVIFPFFYLATFSSIFTPTDTSKHTQTQT
jgi:hypothetical protein